MKIASRTILSVTVGIASSAIWAGVWIWCGLESVSIDFVFSTIGVGFAIGWFLHENAAQKEVDAQRTPLTTPKTRSWRIRDYFLPISYDSLNTIKYDCRVLYGRLLFFILLAVFVVVPAITISILNGNYAHMVYFSVLLLIILYFSASDFRTLVVRKRR